MRPRKNNDRLNLRALDCALRCLRALPASPSASYVMLHTLHYIKRCAPASLDLCVAVAEEGEERRGEALSRFSERLSRGNAGRAPLSLFLGLQSLPLVSSFTFSTERGKTCPCYRVRTQSEQIHTFEALGSSEMSTSNKPP